MAWYKYVMNEFIDDFLDAKNSEKRDSLQLDSTRFSLWFFGAPLKILNDLWKSKFL
jgi:hypothetical protein